MKTNINVSEVWADELPTSTGGQKATVELMLYVALSDQKPSGFSTGGQFGAAWRLYREDGSVFAEGCNAMSPALGDHTKGFYPAVIEGASAAPAGAIIEVVSDLRYGTDQLQGVALWEQTSFRKKDGKPYADALQMRRLHTLLSARGQSITGRPPADDDKHRLGNLKLWAKEIAQNNGRSPDEWGL